jgi:transcription termination/antitermination protein NusG
LFKVNQAVRVVDGPFASFKGLIERLDSNGRLKVLVDIFSRMTPVELDEDQIEAA